MGIFHGLALAACILRESLPSSPVQRSESPSIALGDQVIQNAMDGGGMVDGRTAGGYLFHTVRISHALAGSTRCLDLGCCTGQQLLQVAAVNPQIEFIGVDQSPRLLARASEIAVSRGVHNVQWLHDDITTLAQVPDGSVDAVISSMTLNDLAHCDALRACLQSIRRVLSRDREICIYIEDFLRLKSARTIETLADMVTTKKDDPFRRLYVTALHSAFSYSELGSLIQAELPGVEVFTTRPLPFLVVMRTPERGRLDTVVAKRLLALIAQLDQTQKGDFNALGRLFALGGMSADPLQKS